VVTCQDEEIEWVRCFGLSGGPSFGYGITRSRNTHGRMVEFLWLDTQVVHLVRVILCTPFTPTKEEVLAWQLGKMRS
jgi:hypothetical protein